MMTIEVFTSDTDLSEERGRELARRLRDCLTTGHSAPASVVARAQELTHVTVHRPLAWATGGPDPERVPRYLLRVTVPGTWIGNEFGEHAIPALTSAVGEFDGDPQRLHHHPHCVVQVIGLREGTFGTRGVVTSSSDVTRMMTEDYRESADLAGGTVDPVCGMTVDPATARHTLTVDGIEYAFCASVCRKVFAEDHGIAV
ncbi:ATPase [Nocardia sp. CDC153]|uniref:ATPase n=1 Tax=Nocardia sp. CDC153 TaxID=3112167 RepID=UPI002DB72C8A|nr:ATPase [Nocardia sp. CDC153]MEC3953741.1 ATPase [Nocardia sp. CDC153]